MIQNKWTPAGAALMLMLFIILNYTFTGFLFLSTLVVSKIDMLSITRQK